MSKKNNLIKLKILLEREKTIKLICAELNNFIDLRNSLITILTHIRTLTNCQAVGIRLHNDGDYPYYVYDGFPESFIQKENSLCARSEDDKRILDPDGKGYLLECMCGNIIRGKFDPTKPFFTQNGSFWSNNTSALLASTTDKDRQGRTRNHCNSVGYESVSLIPIKSKGEIIGLIQLNDKRTDMFTEDFISYLEMIGEQIGLAVQNSLIFTKLQKAFEEIIVLRGILPICTKCKKIRDDKGYWTQIESYIRDHSEAEFSHGICPNCAKELYPELEIDQS